MIPLLPGLEFLPHLPQILTEKNEYAALRPITPEAVAEVCRLGFMPMGLGADHSDILLVKSHRRRMVLDLEKMHVPRNVRRYARGLTVSVNRQFSDVLAEIDRYHRDSWISATLGGAFQMLHERPISGVRFHSVEICDPENAPEAPPLAAEIGYSVGGVYTSLSGYHTRNGSGWVQMTALGRMLQARHAAFWDLGMDIEYKRRLGALPLERTDFLNRYRDATATAPGDGGESILPREDPVWARELIVQGSVFHGP